MIDYEEKWIIPCNTKHFDVTQHFSTTDTVVWNNSFTIKKNDTVYIYLSAPYSQILYRCKVIQDTVEEKTLQNNSYAIPAKKSHNYFSKKEKYIILRLERVYPKGLLTLQELKKHGLGQVQIQARPDRQLRAFLSKIDEEIDKAEQTVQSDGDENV